MAREKPTVNKSKVSLNSQQGLWESSGGMTANRFAAMISQGRIEDAIAELDHAGYKHGNDPSIDRVFHDKIAVIQKWMERMLDLSVADGAYAWKMIKGMDLPWDSVDSWWADHKPDIIKPLLILVNKGWWDRVIETIDHDLIGELDLRWPELAIIRKSADAEWEREQAQWTDLDESSQLYPFARKQIQDRVQDVGREIRKPHTSLALRALILRLADTYHLTSEEMREFLAPIMDDILAFIEANIGGRAIAIALGDVAAMARNHVLTPEIRAVVNKHKPEIIRLMLSKIKEHTPAHAMDFVEMMNTAGIKWPELDIIRQANETYHSEQQQRLKAEYIDQQRRRRGDLDEADDDEEEDEGPIVSISSPDQQIVDHMYRRMREGSWMALQDAISELEQRRMPDHMIEEILSPQAGSIVRWIDNQIQEGSHNNRMIEQAWKLLEMGARWPSLVQLFNKHKDLMVRDMLRQMKTADSLDLEDIEGHLRQLSELGMNWPEMAVISNSVNAELDRIHNIDESGDMLGYRISKGDLIDGMRDSLRAGHNGAWGNNYAHLRPFWKPDFTVRKLTGIKPDIVAWINKYLSSDNPANWRYGKRAVVDLDHLGVDWPELWRTVDSNKRAWLHPWLSEVKEVLPRRHWDDLADLEDKIVVWQRMFESHGLKWPEIATILASIRGETNTLAEANIEDPVIKQLKNLLNKDRIYEVMELLRRHSIQVSKHPELIKLMWEKRDLIKELVRANILHKSYGAAYEKIADILDTGINWPWLREMADAVPKEDVIRHLLTKMRKDNLFGMDDVPYTIKGARRLGYDWPELAAIEKSLRASGTINESSLAKAAVEEAKQMLWRELPDGNWWILGRALDKMIYAKVPPSEIYAVLDEYKEDILAQQNKLTQADTGSEVMAGLSNLRKLREIGAGWPEIGQMITRNKHHIMRAALQEIKNYSTEEYGEELPHIYKNLRQLKVDWPEMAVIADGILSIQQLGEDWHDVDTDDYDEVYGRLGSALQDIDNGLRDHMDDWHAEMAVNGLADLAQLLDNHDWLETPTPSQYSLDLVKQKPLFVKALLMALRADADYDNIKDAIRMLEDYWHVRWPELDTINKSMRAGKLKESEPSYDEEAYRYAEEMAANLPEVAANPVDAMYVFLHAADHPEVIGPWAAEYFAPHKDLWIRFLLEQMKSDEYATDEIYEAVSMLKRMRLPWPELDVIARSIGADFRG